MPDTLLRAKVCQLLEFHFGVSASLLTVAHDGLMDLSVGHRFVRDVWASWTTAAHRSGNSSCRTSGSRTKRGS